MSDPSPTSLAPRGPAAIVEPGADSSDPTYYDMPVVKEPVWIWTVPAYFVVGGVAGATSVLVAACEIAADRETRQLQRWGRRVATLGDLVGSALLIADLGRPSRFLNMLRVFRPTSPMSVGSWVLAGSGAANSAALLLGTGEGALGRLGRGASLLAGVLGGPLAGYTAVLLSNTVIPVWNAADATLPALFVASAASSAGWLLTLLPLPPQERRIARRFALVGTLSEVVLAAVVERQARRVPRVGRPLREGVSGALWKASKALAIGALATAVLSPETSRRQRWAAGLALGAAALTRFGLFQAGKSSARDPRASFHQQRAAPPRRPSPA